VPVDDRVTQASAYLRMLLLRPGDYRATWQRRTTRPAHGTIDCAAVARVLAAPDVDAVDTAVDPDLLSTVRGALDGTSLCPQTLERFVDAFSLRPREAQRLSRLLQGTESVRVLAGGATAPPDLRRPGGPPGHETLSLHELHILGPDGWPAEHQTIQVIRSTVDGLRSLPYRFDTDELVVEVVRGGSIGRHVYPVRDGVWAVDIVLDEPLARGETALLQYRTTFFYKSAPPPEFRRAVLGATRDLTMWLTFHRDRLPRRVWQARWDGVDHARIVEREPVELDDELSVHCRFGAVERAVVGFSWEWD